MRFRKEEDIRKVAAGLREQSPDSEVKILTSCPACLQGLSRYHDDANADADYIVVEMAKAVLGDNWMADYVAKASHGGVGTRCCCKRRSHLRRMRPVRLRRPVSRYFWPVLRAIFLKAHHDLSLELCAADGGELLYHDAKLRIVLVNDADYPGFCRVIWNAHVREMTDLPRWTAITC